MIVTSETFARPARASFPDAPGPYVAVWLAPKLNDKMSIAFVLLVLGPGVPSMTK
jgi:hypothetical protein